MESTSRRGETYEEASKRDRRNSQGLMEAGGHVAASIRKKDFRAVFDLQSQGVCDSHKACVIICIGVLGFFMFCKFGESFHGVLESNLHGISFAGGLLIYVGISARVKDVAEGLKEIDSCGYVFDVTHSFLLELICENEELLVQGRVRLNRWRAYEGGNKWVYMVSQSVRENIWRSFVVNNNGVRDRGRNVHRGLSQCTRWFQVGEIMMRDLQGMQRYLQEREDSRKLQQEGCTGGRVRDQ
ncbi:hypothetical protein YC2023_058815 [Brassica napus]